MGCPVLVVLCITFGARAQGALKCKFDPDWPKPLPNHWKLGGISGLAIDRDDNIWVLNRPSGLRDLELHAELNPPPDKQQQHLYISDITSGHIWFINRENGAVVGTLGSMGQNDGQFCGLQMIAIDSRDDIFTGEVWNGERVQGFAPIR